MKSATRNTHKKKIREAFVMVECGTCGGRVLKVHAAEAPQAPRKPTEYMCMECVRKAW